MSLIALAFTMCTPLICETYLIDTSEDISKAVCNSQYVEHSMSLTHARNSNKGRVKEWGWAFSIPDADKAISYAFDCVVIQDEELP